MIVLDSDHLSVLQRPHSAKSNRLEARIDDSTDQDFATTVVSLEEQTRGWLAAINRKRDVYDQILYYARLASIVDFYGQWTILPFDELAAVRFVALRQSVELARWT